MEITNKTYPNGLRSLSVLNQDTESVTVMFLIGAGSRHETQSEAGLAHFVEHTLFKGTQKRPNSKQIGMEIESFGGSSNAFTSYDYTGYYIKSPAVNFRQSLEILSDMVQHPLFADAEIARERGVIIEEIKMYEDRPSAKVMQLWLNNFFRGNNLGLDIIGTEDSLNAMQRQQFLEFLSKHYRAENMLLVVAGNVEQSAIDSAVADYCNDLVPTLNYQIESPFTKFNFQPDAQRQSYVKHQKDVEQTHVVLGGLAVDRNHSDRFALQLANTILGSGFGSRLFQVIRDELGLAYYVYSKLSSYADCGVYQLAMGVDSSRVDQAISAAKKELLAVAAGNYTDAEFSRAKNYLLGSFVTDIETSEDIAGFYGMQELLQKEKLTIQEVKQRILALTKQEVTNACAQVYKEDNIYTAQVSRN